MTDNIMCSYCNDILGGRDTPSECKDNTLKVLTQIERKWLYFNQKKFTTTTDDLDFVDKRVTKAHIAPSKKYYKA